MKKVSSEFLVLAFIAGSLVNGPLGWLYGSEGALGRSVAVALVAWLLWAARGLPGAVFGTRQQCYPLRDAQGRFVSRKTLRENHAARKEPDGMYPQGTSMWPGRGQPSPYSAPLDPFKDVQ